MALANALYSTLVLDLDMVGYFLKLQETRLAPRYIAKPLVERRSFVHPAQSASEKAFGFNEDAL
jgi:hypothetical protein